MSSSRRRSAPSPPCASIRRSSANRCSGCRRCGRSGMAARQKRHWPNCSDGRRRRKICCRRFSGRWRLTLRLERFRTRFGESSANTRNRFFFRQAQNIKLSASVVSFAEITAMKLILASASLRRAEILHDAGLSFVALSSAVDETPIPGESPHELVQRLADAKADLVSARAVGPVIIIAADTEVVLDGHVLGKPRTSEDARNMLVKLAGRRHSVITGVTLIRLPDAERRNFVETTHVHFSAIPEEEIRRYLATGEPFDKAGSYAIQGRAGRYVPRIEGCYFNIVGLPLARLCQSLAELGWSEDASPL